MSFFKPKIGIDLGTSNTAICTPDGGVVFHEPTSVAILKSENRIIAIGKEAHKMLGKNHDGIDVINPIENGLIIASATVEGFLKICISRALGWKRIFRPEIFVSICDDIDSSQKRILIETLKRVGASEVFIENQTILAGLGAGIPIDTSSGRVVVTLGGGKVNASVISLGGIISSTSSSVAGIEMDKSIVKYIEEKHSLVVSMANAEKLKIKVAAAVLQKNEISCNIEGRSISSSLPKTKQILQNEIFFALSREYKAIMEVIKRVLHNIPPDLSADIIKNGILLTGGCAKIKGLDLAIKSVIGVEATVAKNSQGCVIEGIAELFEYADFYKRQTTSKK